MPRPSRFRRVAKWVGLGVCVVILGLGAFSGTHHLMFATYGDGTSRSIHLIEAQLFVVRTVDPAMNTFATHWQVKPRDLSLVFGKPFSFSSDDGLEGRVLPLWLPLVIVAIPTALLWYRDRRPRKGHCPHCGYNLTGAEHEKCPKCGAGIAEGAG